MITIKDVARTAGVSVQTVSNVINGKVFVRPETEQRVREAIELLNYYPSRVAQGMRRQASQTIGFLVSDPNPRGLADPFHGEVMAGISDVAHVYNYSLLIDRPALDGDALTNAFLRPFQTRQIDAAIITLSGMVGLHTAVLEELVHAEVLFAILEQDAPGEYAYSVLGANYEGAYSATQKLIELGHRRVAFLHSVQMWPAVDLRLRGYEAAMRDHDLADFITTATGPDWTVEGGAVAMARLLEQGEVERPSAVVAGNDVLALGAIHAVRARELRIPEDVAIIGFDDFDFARYVDPPLTTMTLPAYEMGRCAAELLIKHLQGRFPDKRRIVLPTELILRRST